MIGNPPYIQLQDEGGKLAKLYRQAKFNTFSSMGDIYQLFYEKGIVLLKEKGHLCYITSNKWMRAGYGETSRKYLAEQSHPKILIDLAGEKVFENATVDVNILLLQKGAYTKSTCALRGGLDCLKDRSDLLERKNEAVNIIFPHNSSWVILSPIEQRIKEKIEKVGVPLKDWDIQINYGIKTGCNEAFIIDRTKRDELIALSPNSVEIIRPILRGRDIKRYGYDFADTYLLNVHNGIREKGIPPINIDDYPAVKAHLDQYWDKISGRDDRGKTPYNLRNCAYMDDFNKQKVAWARLMRIAKNAPDSFPRFALVDAEHYVLDSLCFFTGKNIEYLIQILNSEYAAYYFFKNIAILDNGGMQMRQQYVESIPLPKIVVNKDICNIDKLIYAAFNFNDEEQVFIKNYVQSRKQYLRL